MRKPKSKRAGAPNAARTRHRAKYQKPEPFSEVQEGPAPRLKLRVLRDTLPSILLPNAGHNRTEYEVMMVPVNRAAVGYATTLAETGIDICRFESLQAAVSFVEGIITGRRLQREHAQTAKEYWKEIHKGDDAAD